MTKITKTITETWYDSGGYIISLNGMITCIKYNTGDTIYLDESHQVWSIYTHDGVGYTYHNPFRPTSRVVK